jgi:hypothetical protein
MRITYTTGTGVKWLVAAVLVLLATPAIADGPEVDADFLWASKLLVDRADALVAERGKALSETPEYKAYKQAEQDAQAVKAGIQAKVKAKAPGFVFDVKSGQLKPE